MSGGQVRATVLSGVGRIEVRDVPGPRPLEPTDAIVRTTAACVCGSDLWPYRGIPPIRRERTIGHEMIGVVEEVGAAAADRLSPGDFVIVPFSLSCGACQTCRHGQTGSCERRQGLGGRWPDGTLEAGAQAERVRVPLAASSLIVVPSPVEPELIPHLLTLSDVYPTGHHAAVSAGVGPHTTVVVVGDGAVGLLGVLSASVLGAPRIIAMSRNPQRQALAREFGATDIVPERGEDGVEAVRELLGGDLADAALECVGTNESMAQAVAVTRGGGRVGYVGLPHGELDLTTMFWRNTTLSGGVAPVTAYVPSLLPDVLAGRVRPGRVFDLELRLEDVAEGYAAMHERRAIKALLWLNGPATV